MSTAISAPLDVARVVEPLADRAWPAAEQTPLGPWKLRATRNITWRANSVYTAAPAGAGNHDVDALITAAEAFYARIGQQVIFHLSPATWPDGLDARLEQHGYELAGWSEVWTANASTVVQRTNCDARGETVEVSDTPDGAWLDVAYDEPGNARAVQEAIVRRIAAPCAFVSVRDGSDVLACGLAVSDGHWAGFFSIVTRPEARRRGRARLIFHALSAWAIRQRATQLYLQVLARNSTAKTFFTTAGFAFAYPYTYRLVRDRPA